MTSAILSLYPAFLPLPAPKSIINQQYSPLLFLNRTNNRESNMFQYTINDGNNSFNTTNPNNTTTNNNVSNCYYAVGDDLSPLLTWLSPLDPGLRHCDIQQRRVANVGEWLMETREFKKWCRRGGGGEDDKAVLFCYGNPGVGKTFIR